MTESALPPAVPDPSGASAVPPVAPEPVAPGPVAPQPTAGKPTPLWGILAICLGAVGFILAFLLPVVAWLPAVAGLVLGIIGLTRKGAPKALPLTGTIVSGVAWFLAIIMAIVYGVLAAQGIVSAVNQATPPAPGPVITQDGGTGTETGTVALDANGYRVLTDHDYAVLVQDPAAAKGQKVLVYGKIYQKDKATGKCAFLAATAGTQATMGVITGGGVQEAWFNTANKSSCPAFTDFAKGDYFVAEVQVFGTKSFKNTKGGKTLVPLYRVEAMELLPNP